MRSNTLFTSIDRDSRSLTGGAVQRRQKTCRAVDIADTNPYSEITRYLAIHRGAEQQAFRTLSYFAGANFAKRAKATTLFSVALMDKICPPSTVYASYNAYQGDRSIEVYGFNDHEGGGFGQKLRQITWLKSLLA